MGSQLARIVGGLALTSIGITGCQQVGGQSEAKPWFTGRKCEPEVVSTDPSTIAYAVHKAMVNNDLQHGCGVTLYRRVVDTAKHYTSQIARIPADTGFIFLQAVWDGEDEEIHIWSGKTKAQHNLNPHLGKDTHPFSGTCGTGCDEAYKRALDEIADIIKR